jgi:hypothetical protein
VVIDRETGRTPPTAAERMAEHDRRMGSQPAPPAARRSPEEAAADLAPEVVELVVEAPVRPANPAMAATVAAMNRKQPWKDRPRKPAAAPARIARPPQPQPQRGDRKSFTTGKWWDAKGPRTVTLGPSGQAELTGGFLMLFFGLVIAAIIAAFVALPLLFVGGFLLVRFGGRILGPAGARIIDKAIAEKG